MISDKMLKKAAKELDQSICDSLPDEASCDHVFSKKFEGKMKRLIRRTKYAGVYRLCKSAAAVLLVMLTLSACVLAFSKGVRADVLYWSREQESVGIPGYQCTGAADPAGVPRYRLTWVPEGYEPWSYKYDSDWIEEYTYCKDERLLSFICLWGGKRAVLGYSLEERETTVGGRPAMLFISVDGSENNSIVWYDETGEVLCSICALADEQTLVKLAESVVNCS